MMVAANRAGVHLHQHQNQGFNDRVMEYANAGVEEEPGEKRLCDKASRTRTFSRSMTAKRLNLDDGHKATAADIQAISELGKKQVPMFAFLDKHWAIKPALVVIFWYMQGIVFYKAWNGWSAAKSFFYTVDSGLSIGFGAFVEGAFKNDTFHENCIANDDWVPDQTSMAFTVYNIFFGAVAVAGVLGTFIESVVEENQSYFESQQDKMKKSLVPTVPPPQVKRKDSSGELAALRDKAQRAAGTLQGSWESNRQNWLLLLFFLAWVGAGVTFGMVHEEHPFFMALEFSVSAMSTGGIVAPKESNWGLAFMGVFCTVGVPLFGVCLGTLAGIIAANAQAKKVADKLTAQISAAEFDFVQRLGSDDGRIDRGEFLIMSLLRIGATDMQLIKLIDQQFDAMDADDSGYVTRGEVDGVLTFCKYDMDKSGFLGLSEFIGLMTDLKKSSPHIFEDHNWEVTDLPDLFAKLDANNNGHIGRAEFLEFWKERTLAVEGTAKRISPHTLAPRGPGSGGTGNGGFRGGRSESPTPGPLSRQGSFDDSGLHAMALADVRGSNVDTKTRGYNSRGNPARRSQVAPAQHSLSAAVAPLNTHADEIALGSG